MTIGIIGAMEEEVELLKTKLDNRKETTIAGCEFHQGTINNKEIVLLKSGIGKVNCHCKHRGLQSIYILVLSFGNNTIVDIIHYFI